MNARNTPSGFDWSRNPEITAAVVEKYGGGMSASQIALWLKQQHRIEVSRNSVIGIVARKKVSRSPAARATSEGLGQRMSGGALPRVTKAPAQNNGLNFRKAPAPQPPPKPPSFPRTEIKHISRNPTPMVDLTHSSCRWPLWHGDGAPLFLHCGDPRAEGDTYCAAHKPFAYQKPVAGPKAGKRA